MPCRQFIYLYFYLFLFLFLQKRAEKINTRQGARRYGLWSQLWPIQLISETLSFLILEQGSWLYWWFPKQCWSLVIFSFLIKYLLPSLLKMSKSIPVWNSHQPSSLSHRMDCHKVKWQRKMFNCTGNDFATNLPCS